MYMMYMCIYVQYNVYNNIAFIMRRKGIGVYDVNIYTFDSINVWYAILLAMIII